MINSFVAFMGNLDLETNFSKTYYIVCSRTNSKVRANSIKARMWARWCTSSIWVLPLTPPIPGYSASLIGA